MTKSDTIQDKSLSMKSLLHTWIPLAVMWILMAVEHPAISAVLSRTGDATQQLAAFGFSFALALFIEGPIVQMLAAGTAIASNRENYKKLLLFMHILGWGATGIHLILILPPVYDFIAIQIFNLPHSLIEPSRQCLIYMLPWTVTVGYRRLWQGVLIRYSRTSVIPITMAARLSTSLLILLWGYHSRILPGALLGGLALTGGTTAGAVAAYFYARPLVKSLPITGKNKRTGSEVYSWRYLISFYIPLALMNFLNLGARPLMNLGIARGYLPVESLALWPVLFAFFFLFTSLSMSMQEIVIAKNRGPQSFKSLTGFVHILAFSLFLLFFLIGITPLWKLWFYGVSGISPELGVFIPASLKMLFPLPLFTAYVSLLRGYLIHRGRTKIMSVGVLVNVTVLLGVIIIGVSFFQIPAIYIATGAFSSACIVEFLFLFAVSKRQNPY